MLSIIIPTHDSERTLVPTLAALVPGATAGLVREVLIVDSGSQDETAAVAEVAGCTFLLLAGPLGKRLKTAADQARGPWLLFLRPGTVLDTPWTGEAQRFLQQPSPDARAAVFRRGTTGQPALSEAFAVLAGALRGRPLAEQSLIIAKEFYQEIGGHSEPAADPETELIRRIGRRRMVTLPTSAFPPR